MSISNREHYLKYHCTDESKKQRNDYRKRRWAEDREHMRSIQRRSERKRKLREDYGLSLAQYKNLFEAQSCLCAICQSTTSNSKRDWHVDHDHITGTVRGILCHHCNLMLGNAKDNIATLRNAITYLRRYVP